MRSSVSSKSSDAFARCSGVERVEPGGRRLAHAVAISLTEADEAVVIGSSLVPEQHGRIRPHVSEPNHGTPARSFGRRRARRTCRRALHRMPALLCYPRAPTDRDLIAASSIDNGLAVSAMRRVPMPQPFEILPYVQIVEERTPRWILS